MHPTIIGILWVFIQRLVQVTTGILCSDNISRYASLDMLSSFGKLFSMWRLGLCVKAQYRFALLWLIQIINSFKGCQLLRAIINPGNKLGKIEPNFSRTEVQFVLLECVCSDQTQRDYSNQDKKKAKKKESFEKGSKYFPFVFINIGRFWRK